MSIEQGTEQDIERCVQLGADMHAEGHYADLVYDHDIAAEYGRRVCEYGCFLVARKDEDIVGFFTGSLQQYRFGPEYVAVEELLYVAPEHRTGSTGYRLLKAFMQWAQDSGASEVSFATSVKHRKGFDALAERLGMYPVGVVYKAKLNG